MLQKVNGIIKSNSLFIQLTIGFIIVILIMCSFYMAAYNIFQRNYKTEIVEKTENQFSTICNKIDWYINDIQYKFIQFCNSYKNETLFNNYLNGYDLEQITMASRSFLYDNIVNPAFFLLSKNSDFIITPEGTYRMDLFFNYFLKSRSYDADFWKQHLKDSFLMKIYAGEYFMDVERGTKHFYVPVVYKYNNSNMILVALFDFISLLNSFEYNYADDFFIVSRAKGILYQKTSLSIDFNHYRQNTEKYYTLNNGYLLGKDSSENDEIYYKFIPDVAIKSQLDKIYRVFIIIILLPVVFSFLIAIYFVGKFNNPVKQIFEMINLTEKHSLYQFKPVNIKYLKGIVQNLLTLNSSYINEINVKDSILQTSFYQAKLKNMESFTKRNDSRFILKNTYILILFKLHFRQRENLQQEIYMKGSAVNLIDAANLNTSIQAAYLKNHIESEMLKSLNDSITFYIENDQIISIINTNLSDTYISNYVEQILDKLDKELNFPYITAVISRKLDNTLQLHEAYIKLSTVSMHRQLGEINQILTEKNAVTNNKCTSFSIEQAARLTDLINKGMFEEVITHVGEILEYNAANNVNNFYFHLLCVEIMNSILKHIAEKHGSIPDGLNIPGLFEKLRNCNTLDQYRSVCSDFITEAVVYLHTIPENNHNVIEFIKSYVADNYSKDIYLDLLADKLKLSKAYLSYYFKNKTGMGFIDYLNDYRIKKSMLLLSNTNMKVNDIAVKTGFNNINTYIRTFKRYTGITPKEYQRNSLFNDLYSAGVVADSKIQRE